MLNTQCNKYNVHVNVIHVQKWRDIACPSSFGKRAHTATRSSVHIVQVEVNANDCKTLMQVLFLHYLTLNSGHNKRPQDILNKP